MTPHSTSGRDPRQNPQRLALFPSRMVLPLRLRPWQHPVNIVELGSIDMVMEPLFSILKKLAVLSVLVNLHLNLLYSD